MIVCGGDIAYFRTYPILKDLRPKTWWSFYFDILKGQMSRDQIHRLVLGCMVRFSDVRKAEAQYDNE